MLLNFWKLDFNHYGSIPGNSRENLSGHILLIH